MRSDSTVQSWTREYTDALRTEASYGSLDRLGVRLRHPNLELRGMETFSFMEIMAMHMVLEPLEVDEDDEDDFWYDPDDGMSQVRALPSLRVHATA